jgi:hypothetical protein
LVLGLAVLADLLLTSPGPLDRAAVDLCFADGSGVALEKQPCW